MAELERDSSIEAALDQEVDTAIQRIESGHSSDVISLDECRCGLVRYCGLGKYRCD